MVEASRCLTGHGIDNIGQTGNYLYRAANHDNGAKQVFGLAVAAGGGEGDVQRLLDHLAVHPATARFICEAARAAIRRGRSRGGVRRRASRTSSCARTATCAR